MSDKGLASHHDHVPAQQAKKRGLRRHCARRWWVYLIALILIIVLVVLLIIFVAIPKLAQKNIDEAEMAIDGISALNTQADNYTLSINGTVRSHSSIKATLGAFTAQMYLEDVVPHRPFADLYFPAAVAEELTIVNLTQFTRVTDLAAFTQFNAWLLSNDSLRVTVSGQTNVQLSGLSKLYPVSFQKTTTMAGLRRFNGTEVTSASVTPFGDANGDNFHGFVTVPNHSNVTFEIGNATFHNYLLGEEIGTVFIDNMVLRPGMNNNFSMRANISNSPILTAMAKKPYCETGFLPFELRGKNVVNHDQRLAYYADALATSNQTTEINIAKALKDSLNITIACA